MQRVRVRFLEKGEAARLPKGAKLLPKGWQRAYIERRKPYYMEEEAAVLQTTAEQSPYFRKQAAQMLEKLKRDGVEIIIPPVEGELPRDILPFADGRRLTNLFAFPGAKEILKRQGKNPEECRYLLAGGNEEAWRTALISMGNEVNHLAVFTADTGEAKKLEQELFEEYGLMAEVFASPKHPAFGAADVVFGCGMEQRRYEYMLGEGAVWIDLAGNRPVLRKLAERRRDVVALDGFFFRKGKEQMEGRMAEAEAFLSCDTFRRNFSVPLSETEGKGILCELQERGYALSGFSLMGNRVKIKKNQGFQRENIDNSSQCGI